MFFLFVGNKVCSIDDDVGNNTFFGRPRFLRGSSALVAVGGTSIVVPAVMVAKVMDSVGMFRGRRCSFSGTGVADFLSRTTLDLASILISCGRPRFFAGAEVADFLSETVMALVVIIPDRPSSFSCRGMTEFLSKKELELSSICIFCGRPRFFAGAEVADFLSETVMALVVIIPDRPWSFSCGMADILSRTTLDLASILISCGRPRFFAGAEVADFLSSETLETFRGRPCSFDETETPDILSRMTLDLASILMFCGRPRFFAGTEVSITKFVDGCADASSSSKRALH
jgi:uncharacterized protein (DUF2461 family)